MAILKFKDENNQWQDLPALRGRDGVIQYQAGDGITINDNTISAEVPVLLSWDGTTGSTTAVKAFFQQVVDAHASGKDVFVVGRKANSDLVGELIYILRKDDTIQTGSPYGYYKMLGTATASVSQNSYNHSSFSLTETNIHIYGQLVNGRFTVNNVITSEGGYQLDYLDTQGVYTAPYIPDRDDRPATKKYVDDAVASAGGTSESFFIKLTTSSRLFSGKNLTLNSTDKAAFSPIYEYIDTNDKLPNIIIATSAVYNTPASFLHITGYRKESNTSISLYGYSFTTETSSDEDFGTEKLAAIIQYRLEVRRSDTTSYTISQIVMDNYRGEYLSTSNNIAFTPTGDYNPATKKYVDDSIAAIPSGGDQIVMELISDISFYVGDINTTLVANESTTPNALAFWEKIKNFESNNDFTKIVINLRNLDNYTPRQVTLLFQQTGGTTYGTGVTFSGTLIDTANTSTTLIEITFIYNNSDKSLNRYQLKAYTWKGLTSKGEVLTKTNTSSFTPTSNYHPATKKYVDDSIPGVATTSANGLMSATDKTSLNDLVTAVGSVTSTDVTNWNTAANNSHTHSNKSLLDTITSSDVSDWNNAVTNSHSHSNKTVLDSISSSDITNWNKVHIYSGTATPGAGTGEDGDIYVKYTA